MDSKIQVTDNVMFFPQLRAISWKFSASSGHHSVSETIIQLHAIIVHAALQQVPRVRHAYYYVKQSVIIFFRGGQIRGLRTKVPKQDGAHPPRWRSEAKPAEADDRL